jgi:hypothetical protein
MEQPAAYIFMWEKDMFMGELYRKGGGNWQRRHEKMGCLVIKNEH